MEEKKNEMAEMLQEQQEAEPAATLQEVSSAAPQTKPAESIEPVDETGIVAAHTKVTGDIVTRGHLVIYGEVEGSITAAGNVTATGKIVGDIICSNLKLAGCQAKSNLTVKNNIVMDEGAKVEGGINCRALSVDGYIKGDIEAAEELQVYSNATVTGSIHTKSIRVDAGAQLQGNIQVVK